MDDPQRGRAWLGAGLGGLLSMLAIPTVGTTTGCILPDNCIAFPQPTVDVCKQFANAMDLTMGLPLLDETDSVPRGCLCLEQADADTLLAEDADPDSPVFEVLQAQLDGNARADCVAIAVASGLTVDDTNCMTADEILGDTQDSGVGECESRYCDFAPEPLVGSCPEDGSLCPGASAPAAETGDSNEQRDNTSSAMDSTTATTDGVDSTS